MLPDLKTPLLWVLGLALLAALATAGIERTQVHKARADVSKAQKALADEKLDRQAENTRRALVALDDLQRVLAMQAAHAKAQKENVDAYEKKLAVLEGSRRAAIGDAERMRKQFADFAARDRSEATSDPAACQRVADRSASLASVAAEGAELLLEGRLLVRQRDAEVMLLKDIVTNDRVLFKPALPTAP